MKKLVHFYVNWAKAVVLLRGNGQHVHCKNLHKWNAHQQTGNRSGMLEIGDLDTKVITHLLNVSSRQVVFVSIWTQDKVVQISKKTVSLHN